MSSTDAKNRECKMIQKIKDKLQKIKDCFCKRGIESIKGEMKSQADSIKGEMKPQTEAINGEMKTQAEAIKGAMKSHADIINSNIDELKQKKNNFDMVQATPQLLFNELCNPRKSGVIPDDNLVNGEPSTVIQIVYDESAMKKINECSGKSVSCNFMAWLIPIITVFALLTLLFLPVCCSATVDNTCVTISSTKTNVPIKVDDSHKWIHGSIYAHRVIIDSVCMAKDTMNNVRPVLHGEVVYRNTSWLFLLYILLAASMIMVSLIFVMRFLMPYCEKMLDNKHKLEAERMRFQNDELEFQRLGTRTQISIYEKREKAKIDEWQRDKEHIRRYEMKEQERIADLSNLLKELARAQNTITIKDPNSNGKTITIERSILSEDCCEQLKGVVESAIQNHDDCCETIKKVARCLFGDQIDCEKVTAFLKGLLCDKDCDNNYSELRNDIDKLKTIIIAMQSVPATNGLQQVVNINEIDKTNTDKND